MQPVRVVAVQAPLEEQHAPMRAVFWQKVPTVQVVGAVQFTPTPWKTLVVVQPRSVVMEQVPVVEQQEPRMVLVWQVVVAVQDVPVV